MKLFKLIFKYTLFLVLSLIIYLGIVTLLSFISVNNKPDFTHREIPIYIMTNGVHSDIAVPLKTEYYNWTNLLKTEHTIAQDTLASYVALGWGDKAFYLETPTWADLKVSTALKATSGLSSSAMHVTFYREIKENDSCKKILISPENYKKLVEFIKESFQYQSENLIKIETDAVYGNHDVFYEAIGSYSLFYTCNSWTNQALKAAQQKAALWTISDTGIFRHYQ